MNPSEPSATLLYVEDEENDVFFMRRALARAGVSVRFESVGDGEKAIAYLAGLAPYENRELPRLVLLDLNLPLRSGFEVLEWLRKQSALSDIHVVIYSSSGRPEDREKARRLGVSDYILKPASSREMVDIARTLGDRWLGTGSEARSPARDVAREFAGPTPPSSR